MVNSALVIGLIGIDPEPLHTTGFSTFGGMPMGAVDPSNVGGDIKKNLWLTLEDLFEGGLKHILAHVGLLNTIPLAPKQTLSLTQTPTQEMIGPRGKSLLQYALNP